MTWVWILLGALIGIVVVGLLVKLILKRKLNSIDGCMGLHKGRDDEDENIIGKF